ncbi:ferritin family protein [Clostridium tagluense]|uniref:ferritin family protein n=1 Tax=Clostridium tagluense TaxID=360422 RepID=UPI001CF0FB98|nr:ferritin family protein [Clostridium tagluense]MCB2297460.1 rubrerythrin [Clostridium tagluense]
MSIFGVTKGTELEKEIDGYYKGEEQGAGMYAALACLAKERGLHEVSDVLMEVAKDEIRHSGIYAVLNGHANEDIFELLRKIAPIESAGVEKLNEFAKRVRDLGLEEAAKQIEAAASDEGRHGELLKDLVLKFS